jgi:hypothetical protein
VNWIAVVALIVLAEVVLGCAVGRMLRRARLESGRRQVEEAA